MKKLVTSILCTVMCVGIFAISTNAESKKQFPYILKMKF